MPGTKSNSRVVQMVGAAFFVVAAVGSAVYGWEFGGGSGTLPTALAFLAVAIAIVVTLSNR